MLEAERQNACLPLPSPVSACAQHALPCFVFAAALSAAAAVRGSEPNLILLILIL